MSGRPTNFADTLANGIQDVAALLPLLGTQQCERHVGSALQKGYLYAAATVLSLFGSLGIVKAAFATLLATITHPFYGGRWLDDAGFNTPGSVSSMVTVAKDTGRYGAEVALEKLLKEQHIDDLNLVKEISWTGWKKEDLDEKSDVAAEHWINTVKAYILSWNGMLILSSFLSAILSISPYLYLMGGHWNKPLSWLFPLLRSFGSFLCVVAVQLALQLRIHCIANTSLTWRKILQNHWKEDLDQAVLEAHIWGHLPPDLQAKNAVFYHFLRRNAPSQLSNDTEKGKTASQAFLDPDAYLSKEECHALEELIAIDWLLMLYQLIIIIGMGMIVTGYVGCFSLVGQTNVPNGPYVWFGLEAALSLIRMFLWGSNPEWDESTSLTVTLELHHITNSKENSSFPVIMSPYKGEQLQLVRGFNPGDSLLHFVAQSEADFLESNAITLFYSILLDKKGETKRLYTTIYFMDSHPALTFSADSSNFDVFCSTLKTNPTTGLVEVKIQYAIIENLIGFIDSQLYHQVIEHLQLLTLHLFGGQQLNSLAIRWNLTSPPTTTSAKGSETLVSMPLSHYDKGFMALQQSWEAKSEYCSARGQILDGLGARDTEYRDKTVASHSASFYGEVLHLISNLILELQLWYEEALLFNTWDPTIAHQNLAECIRATQSHMFLEQSQRLT
uniref:Uncharacterized protein n=2 Tax=Moniliophthora roreri TaxID=221103 RepID=A0A0W0F969_MONRR